MTIERLHRGEQSGYAESARVVARTRAEFDDAWRRVHAGSTPVPASPNVDFGHAMVLVVAMGERPSGGFEIAVNSAQRTAEGVVVHVTSTRPAESCMVPMVIASPVDVVLVDTIAGQVEFREHQAVREC